MDGGDGFIGYYVSLLYDNDSTYEGEVSAIDADQQLITLSHAHQMLPDGSAAKYPQITLTGSQVQNLKIIRQKMRIPDINEHLQKKLLLNDEHKESNTKSNNNREISTTTTNNSSRRRRNSSPNESDVQSNSSNKPSFQQHQEERQQPLQRKRSETGGGYVSQDVGTDFDFEGNNARFDKHAVYEKMLQNHSASELSAMGGKGGVAPLYDPKMRSQDNILESEPVSLRQIKVPLEHTGKEFATEDGFIIPAITLSLKMKLFAAAEKAGLSLHQLVETAGICACQMAIQLVGGCLRLNPQNNHQRPEIVVLAGCHTQGLQAVCAARHLANHRVKVVLYFPNASPALQSHVNLFVAAGGKLIRSTKELPSQPVDMIIDAMIGHENHQPTPWLPYAVSWANQNKAPVLSIDPCIPNTRVELPNIKWAIAMGLPLIKSPTPGRLYLADLGIPAGVFRDAGIKFMSPFKDKFCIPLYES